MKLPETIRMNVEQVLALERSQYLSQAGGIQLTLTQLAGIIEAVPEWVSVEERLPEKSGTYLIHVAPHWTGTCGYYNDGSGWKPGEGVVTHWMPLPGPPEEGWE